MSRRRASTPCPHCDAAVPAGALACPACGSDADTGWADDADAWAGELPDGYDEAPDDDDDYREFLRREGLAEDGQPSRAVLERRGILVIITVLLAALLAWMVLR